MEVITTNFLYKNIFSLHLRYMLVLTYQVLNNLIYNKLSIVMQLVNQIHKEYHYICFQLLELYHFLNNLKVHFRIYFHSFL